jgi:hypothetical protein
VGLILSESSLNSLMVHSLGEGAPGPCWRTLSSWLGVSAVTVPSRPSTAAAGTASKPAGDRGERSMRPGSLLIVRGAVAGAIIALLSACASAGDSLDAAPSAISQAPVFNPPAQTSAAIPTLAPLTIADFPQTTDGRQARDVCENGRSCVQSTSAPSSTTARTSSTSGSPGPTGRKPKPA